MSMMIPDDKISEIRNSADILEIISESVILKRSGRNHIGLCPFHAEKTPSFTVNPDKQIYKCFGCGEGGNVFTFLMKKEGLSFPEAVRLIGKRTGIDIPDVSLSPDQKKRIDEREKIFNINRQALNFFKENLKSGPNCSQAQKYLLDRGFSKETIEKFELGYVSSGWDQLIQYLVKRGISLPNAARSGLIIQKDNNRFYDRFRDRIIFPIFDFGRHVLGFGGRIITASKKQPKYLNSPETIVYHKKKSLYGLHSARPKCRETDTAFIVEGYFDYLALYQHGIENTVATLGTSLTSEHARILKGFASTIYLVFDSDAAGIKAAERGIAIFGNEGIDARIIVLPSGYDPDSYVFEKGPERFLALKEQALTNISFLIQMAIKKYDLSVQGKLGIIKEMMPPLSGISDSVARGLYIKELSERIGIDEIAIKNKLIEYMNGVHNVNNRAFRNDYYPGINNISETSTLKDLYNDQFKIERHLVSMLLQFSGIIDYFKQAGAVNYFENETLKHVVQLILETESEKEEIASDIITKINNDQLRKLIAQLGVGDDKWVDDGCRKLIDQFIANKVRKNDDLDQKIKQAEESKDFEQLKLLLNEKNLQLALLKKKQYISR